MKIEDYKRVCESIRVSNSMSRERYELPGAEVFVTSDQGSKKKTEKIGHNLVVDAASTLIARLVKDPSEPIGGFRFMAVGTGDPSWDPFNPPAPQKAQIKLVNEIARKGFSSAFFVGDDGLPTVTPTDTVDFVSSFGPGEAIGVLLELGVLGGDATVVTDSGTLVSVINFPAKSKQSQETLTFTVRYQF